MPKFVIRAATNRFAPTGGVRKPTSHEMTITMPNTIGSIPSATTIGKSKGVNKMICAIDSRNIPVIIKITAIIISNKNGL